MKYRIQRYGNNGYKIQRLSERSIFGREREKWIDHETGFMEVSWTEEFNTIEEAKKHIKELTERNNNKKIGWKTVYET